MQRCCSWCLAILDTENRTHEVYCSVGCRDANNLFVLHNSDSEINLRKHYFKSKGGSNE